MVSGNAEKSPATPVPHARADAVDHDDDDGGEKPRPTRAFRVGGIVFFIFTSADVSEQVAESDDREAGKEKCRWRGRYGAVGRG